MGRRDEFKISLTTSIADKYFDPSVEIFPADTVEHRRSNEGNPGAFSPYSRIGDLALLMQFRQSVDPPATGIRDTLQLFRGAP